MAEEARPCPPTAFPSYERYHLNMPSYMKQLLTVFFATLSLVLGAQNDTTIYKIVEEMPRFPGCEQLDTTISAKKCL